MKKYLAFLLILAVLIAVFLIAININNSKNNPDDQPNAEENSDTEITGDIIKDDSEKNQTGGSGSGGAGGTNAASGTTPSQEPLPLDLNTKPCGFYFLEYNVCAGTCPEGQCLVDDKSCYCRIG